MTRRRRGRPPRSVLGRRGRCALRRGERLTLQILDRLLELEVLVGGEFEGRRRLLVGVDGGLGARFLRLFRRPTLVLVVEQVLLQVGFAQSSRGRRRGILDDDVRRNPFRLDRAAARRVVPRGGELDGGVVAEREYGLHRALAEGRRAYQRRALVILQRSRHDFRSGRG